MNIGFATPLWLGLLFALPLWWLWLRPGDLQALVVATSRDTSRKPRRVYPLDVLPTLLRTIAVGCVIIALGQPQLIRIEQEPVTEGVGIVLAIDLSTSMWAQDMARGMSRLDAAKATVRQFLATRTDDVGLVSFAGEALTRVPLTHDGYVVDAAVEGLEVGLLLDGTDIAGAIAAGAGLLSDAPHGSKVLVLVTDGAHNKAGLVPALAARAAATVGVTIYPVAIGRQEQATADGMESVLTQAARLTGGRYFRATDMNALEAIYEEIDQLTLPSEEIIERTETDPLAWWFVLAAITSAGLVVVLRGSRWGVLP